MRESDERMGLDYLIDSGSISFKTQKEQLQRAGWRVEWNGDGNACYDPEGNEAFVYGTTPEEHDGAWAYLMGAYLGRER